MKKFILLLVLVAGFSFSASAQQQRDVVYLKNGGIIYGAILELVPDGNVKIKTSDRSVFVYKMSEVEKISKEEIETPPPSAEPKQYVEYRRSKTAPDWEERNYRKQQRRTLRGYKGFFDVAFMGDLDDSSADKFQVLTSHGFQLNNYIFFGGGLGVDYYTNFNEITIPLYMDFRVNFINQKVTPFADFKLGHAFGDTIDGFFVSTSIGVRIKTSGKHAVNVALVINSQDVRYDYYYNYSGYSYYDDEWETYSSFGIKVGLEF